MRVWDTASGKEVARLRGHAGAAHSAEFSPDGRRIVSAGADGTLRVWDAASGEPRLTIRGHVGPAYCAAFSPDGERIASGGDKEDGTVRLWDAATGQEALTLYGDERRAFNGVAFSPDGRWLAAYCAGRVHVWDATPLVPPGLADAARPNGEDPSPGRTAPIETPHD